MKTNEQYNATDCNQKKLEQYNRKSEQHNISKAARTSLWDVTDIRITCLAEATNVNTAVKQSRAPQEFIWNSRKSAFKAWERN